MELSLASRILSVISIRCMPSLTCPASTRKHIFNPTSLPKIHKIPDTSHNEINRDEGMGGGVSPAEVCRRIEKQTCLRTALWKPQTGAGKRRGQRAECEQRKAMSCKALTCLVEAGYYIHAMNEEHQGEGSEGGRSGHPCKLGVLARRSSGNARFIRHGIDDRRHSGVETRRGMVQTFMMIGSFQLRGVGNCASMREWCLNSHLIHESHSELVIYGYNMIEVDLALHAP